MNLCKKSLLQEDTRLGNNEMPMDKMINKRFDEVFDLSLGRTPSRGVGAYWGGTHTWVSIADMSCGKYISESKEHITDKALSDTGIPIVKKGTVIMSFKLSIGKVCIADTDLYTNEAIMAFVPKPQYKILPEFLYYYLMCYEWNNSNEVVLGFTLNKKTISQSIVSIPSSLAEQERIVEILDREFERIDALKVNAEQNLQHAKDLFQSALRQELQCDKYHALNEVYNIKTGKLNSNAAEEGGIFPFFTCSREIFAINTYAFDCEAILLAGNNASGDFNVKYYNGKFNAYQRTYVITAKDEKTNVRILYYILTHYLADLKQMSLGANTKFLKLGMIEDIRIPDFNEHQMRNVVARLDNLNERCQALEESYKKTIALCDDMKQALLRKAFNGEL